MTFTINLSNPVTSLTNVSSQLWLLIVLIIGVALAASIVVEIYKRHYNAKQQEALAKHWVAAALTLSSTVFTSIGYFLVFAQQHSSTLEGFLGRHVPQVIGTAYLIYNFGISKGFQVVANALTKWTGNAATYKAETTTAPTTTETASTTEDLL